MTRRFRTGLGIALLAAQVAAIAYARFVPSRYFAWAPYDSISVYDLDVRVDGRTLSRREVRDRYRLRGFGRDNRSIRHVVDVVRQYEETYGRADGADVRLRYRTDGGSVEEWRWPER